MNAECKVCIAPSINGHMIALGAGHSIAIYERNGKGFVAEFRDGHGSLEYAGSWFRFNAGALRCVRGRAAHRSFMSLAPEMLQVIEGLHAESEAQQERMLAVPRRVAAAALRYFVSAMSRLRGGTSKIHQTLG